MGGTNWLYLSGAPYKEIGMREDLGTVPAPELTAGILSAVPIVVGLWPVLLTGIYAMTKRKEQIAQKEKEQAVFQALQKANEAAQLKLSEALTKAQREKEIAIQKEVKKALHEKQILLNDKEVKNERDGTSLFDKITIKPSKKHYRVNLSKFGRFILEEAGEEESHQKIAKIINKKVLRGKKMQINLSDGRNVLSDIKCKVNDSIVLDFKKKNIAKCLPFKEKQRIIIFAGKHTGKRGAIMKIKPKRKMVELEADGKKINVLIKQVMVIE